jgi:hypothetical protein
LSDFVLVTVLFSPRYLFITIHYHSWLLVERRAYKHAWDIKLSLQTLHASLQKEADFGIFILEKFQQLSSYTGVFIS